MKILVIINISLIKWTPIDNAYRKMILGTESTNYDYLEVGNLGLSVFLFRKEFIVTHICIVTFDKLPFRG